MSNSPVEGSIMIASTIGNGGVAFSDGFPSVVGKSSPVRIAHCGSYANVWDDVIAAPDEEPGYLPNGGSYISTMGYQSTIYAGLMSRTSALGDESRIHLSYHSPTQQLVLNSASAYIAGWRSLISADSYVEESVFITSGEDSIIRDEGTDNTIIATGEGCDISAGENALVMMANGTGTFSLGKGAVAVICQDNEGVKRIVIVREGEDGIQAGWRYRLDENGQVVPD